MASEDARLLPVVEWNGREFLVDIEARQFRNVDDGSEVVDMHSPQGRSIVEQMRGTTWQAFALDCGPTDLTV